MKRITICIAMVFMCCEHLIGQVKNDDVNAEKKGGGFYQNLGCPQEGVSVWPFGDTLYPNSFILIQGLGKDQALVAGLGSDYAAYLSSSKGKINLKVVDKHDGRSNIFQCLLKPENPLEVGVRYKLVIQAARPDDGNKLEIAFKENTYATTYPYIGPKPSNEPRSWQVLDNPNAGKLDYQQLLLWEEPPYVYNELAGYAQATNEMVNFEMNCVNFKFSLKEDAQYFVRVRLTDKQTQQESTFYVIPDGDQIPLGRPNMCYGNYEFKKDEIYRVKFQIMDIYGFENRPTRERSFVSPR